MRYLHSCHGVYRRIRRDGASELDEDNPIKASVIFYSQSYAIERIQTWCVRVHPESADPIQEALDE